MIGLALVSTALVVGQSIKDEHRHHPRGVGHRRLLPHRPARRGRLPARAPRRSWKPNDLFESVTGFRYVETRVDGEIGTNVAADFDQLAPLLNADIREGGYDLTVTNPVLVASKHAEADRPRRR